MIVENPNFDLELLSEHFTECGDYTREVILKDLEYWKSKTDFLLLLSINDRVLDGFLIGYRNRNSLWISQIWRKNDGHLTIARDALEMAKKWARERGMISLTGETDRKQMKAMERHGFKEESVNMKAMI